MSYRRKHIGPKLRRLKPKKPFFKKPVFWVILSLIIVATLSYFILFSWFQVSKINISGNSQIKSEDIENLAISYINEKIFSIGPFNVYSKSILAVSKEKLSKSILSEFPRIEIVEINKKLPDLINLIVRERQQFSVFCDKNNNCFSIDINGVIFQPMENVSGDALVLSLPKSNENFYLGQNVIDRKIMDSVSSIQQNLKNNFQISVEEALISELLIFKTNEGWSIYFDPALDINLQITEMNALLKDEIPEDKRKNLEYIYLQYKDRAYYK